MIKGRFYTGLTDQMMKRSRTVNRQETNFFWPDDTNAPPVPSQTRRTSLTPASQVNNNNGTNEIKPKELFQKQLSSGIEFFDNVDAKTPEARRRRFKKIDNVNLNNADNQYLPQKKKLETFSSKIEFYDLVDEPPKPTRKSENIRNAKKEVAPIKVEVEVQKKVVKDVKKPNESTAELSKKRISFRTEDKSTKSILKNVDEKPLIDKNPLKMEPKRGLTPKSFLSKSVDNMSKLIKSNEDVSKVHTEAEKLTKIISEVRDLNLKTETKGINQNGDDFFERDGYDSHYHNSNRNDREPPRRNNNNNHSRYNYENDDYRDQYEPRNRKYYDRYDRDERDDYRYDRMERNPISYSQPRDMYIDDRSYRSNRTRNSPDHDRYDHDNNYDSYSRQKRIVSRRETTTPTSNERKPLNYRREISPPPTSSLNYDERRLPSRVPNGLVYDSSRREGPRHLRSNISIGGSVEYQPNRPLTVRDSAVTRVGVGLPDIE